MIEAEASDRDLVERMLSGQEEAFAEFFDGHFPRLYRFAMARLNQDADAAEEVVQTVMCRAIAKLRSYRGEAGSAPSAAARSPIGTGGKAERSHSSFRRIRRKREPFWNPWRRVSVEGPRTSFTERRSPAWYS